MFNACSEFFVVNDAWNSLASKIAIFILWKGDQIAYSDMSKNAN